jgi:hypothetical protein
MLGILFGSVQSILKDNLNMCQAAIKFMSHLLSAEEEKNLVSMCQHRRGRLGRDPEFLLKIITGDETWVYRYGPET